MTYYEIETHRGWELVVRARWETFEQAVADINKYRRNGGYFVGFIYKVTLTVDKASGLVVAERTRVSTYR